MANDAVIKLGLDVKGVKKGLDKVQKELKETAKSAAKLDAVQKEMRQIRTESKKLAAALNKSKVAAQKNAAAMSGTKSGLAGLKSGFIAVAAAVGTAYVAVRALDSAFELSAKVEAMDTALANLAGDSERAAAAITAVGNATNGTVSKMEAMRIANTLLNFGIAENANEMEELATIGATLGRSMGLTATKGVEDFSLAIARGSRKILDNLGIILDQEEAYKIHAATLDKNVDQLTKAEKAQSFFVAAMIKGRKKVDEMGGAIKTNADGWLRLKATLENSKSTFATTMATNVELGEGIEDLNGFLEENAAGFAEWAQWAITSMVEVARAAVIAKDTMGGFFSVITGGYLNSLNKMENLDLGITRNLIASMAEKTVEIQTLNAEMLTLQGQIDRNEGSWLKNTQRLASASAEVRKLTADKEALRVKAGKNKKATDALNDALKTAKDRASAARKAFGKLGDVEGEVTTDTVELTKAQKDLKKALDEISGSTSKFAELAGDIEGLNVGTGTQLRLLDEMIEGGDTAMRAIESLWKAGLLGVTLYNSMTAEAVANQAKVIEQRDDMLASALGSLGPDPEMEMLEAPQTLRTGAGADGRPRSLPQGLEPGVENFEDENGFKLTDVMDPDFDTGTALEVWEEVTTALQDGTMEYAEAQRILAENGFRTNDAIEAQTKAMAKQGAATARVTALQKMMGSALANAGGAFIDMAISGDISGKKLVKATLRDISTQAKAKAVFELGKAFAAYPDATGMASHFKSAAIFGTLAIGAGIAGKESGGEGGGGEDRGGGQDSSNDRDIARTTDAADDNQAGGPNVSVIFDGASFVGEPTSEQLALITSAVEQATSNAGGGNSLRGG